ncbi:MAG: hypothetical protein QF510_03430 [Rhodospirillales bacterium]|nr:hypothetical protein [Rhodospirillales bacterium]
MARVFHNIIENAITYGYWGTPVEIIIKTVERGFQTRGAWASWSRSMIRVQVPQ